MHFDIGQRVNWVRQTTRGYGNDMVVAGVVAKLNPKTVTIRVAQIIAGNQVRIVTRNVQRQFLSPRVSYVACLDQSNEQLFILET